MVGGIWEARTAGIRPANAPIRMAAGDAAPRLGGITTAQLFVLVYVAVAVAPARTPMTSMARSPAHPMAARLAARDRA
jgi:hypothetical protein